MVITDLKLYGVVVVPVCVCVWCGVCVLVFTAFPTVTSVTCRDGCNS